MGSGFKLSTRKTNKGHWLLLLLALLLPLTSQVTCQPPPSSNPGVAFFNVVSCTMACSGWRLCHATKSIVSFIECSKDQPFDCLCS